VKGLALLRRMLAECEPLDHMSEEHLALCVVLGSPATHLAVLRLIAWVETEDVKTAERETAFSGSEPAASLHSDTSESPARARKEIG
jgi:hypothetical protein